jgi:hypothetical protein
MKEGPSLRGAGREGDAGEAGAHGVDHEVVENRAVWAEPGNVHRGDRVFFSRGGRFRPARRTALIEDDERRSP